MRFRVPRRTSESAPDQVGRGSSSRPRIIEPPDAVPRADGPAERVDEVSPPAVRGRFPNSAEVTFEPLVPHAHAGLRFRRPGLPNRQRGPGRGEVSAGVAGKPQRAVEPAVEVDKPWGLARRLE